MKPFIQKSSEFLLKKYAEMSGEKKIQIGMDLSQAARNFRAFGAAQTKTPWLPIKKSS